MHAYGSKIAMRKTPWLRNQIKIKSIQKKNLEQREEDQKEVNYFPCLAFRDMQDFKLLINLLVDEIHRIPCH